MRWYLIDTPNVVYRYFYARRGGLADSEIGPVMARGLAQDLYRAFRVHGPGTPAFFFDTKPYERTRLYTPYKEKILSKDVSFMKRLEAARHEVVFLRDKFLRDQGHPNVFWYTGYEADDMIASAAYRLPSARDTAVIVSTDKDLWQLLGPSVVCHNPKTRIVLDHDDFQKEYGVPPGVWASVKAIAGCHSDNVPGVMGVAEDTALRFLKLSMGKKGILYERIMRFVGSRHYQINMKLVKLPFAGTPAVHMAPAERSAQEFDWSDGLEALSDERAYSQGGMLGGSPKRRK